MLVTIKWKMWLPTVSWKRVQVVDDILTFWGTTFWALQFLSKLISTRQNHLHPPILGVNIFKAFMLLLLLCYFETKIKLKFTFCSSHSNLQFRRRFLARPIQASLIFLYFSFKTSFNSLLLMAIFFFGNDCFF